MDKYDRETRSRMMSAVRSKGNKSTERRLRAYLVKSGLHGWRVNPADITGKPDFVFDGAKVAIFVDGCFWHGCPIHCRLPSSRREYWLPKVEGNRKRDRKRNIELRKQGWRVVRVWEHQVKQNPQLIVDRLRRLLKCEGI